MATHSKILAWRIPWTEEPGGLWSIGLQRVGHNWSNLARMHIWCFPRPLLSWDQFSSGSGVPRPSHTHTLWSCLLAFWALSGNDPYSVWLITALSVCRKEYIPLFSRHKSEILQLIRRSTLDFLQKTAAYCFTCHWFYFWFDPGT